MHWLEGGSLLGAVRENGNLLAWKDDVDISFLLDDKTTWPTITKALSGRGN
jgi:phosphorylcholine metabolism protein LicD